MSEATGPAAGPQERLRRPIASVAGRELMADDVSAVNRATTVAQVLPGLAHELNNALQIITGLVEMLTASGQLTPDAQEKVARIGGQAGRAIGLVRDLVGFAKGEHRGIRPVDIARVVEQALAFRRYHIGRARIAVESHGIVPGQWVIRADADDLTQVVLNLVINAEQALASTRSPRIAFEIREAGDDVELVVTDNGPGFPEGAMERATEAFYTTRGPVAGLGLTAAGALTEALGGGMRLESGSEGGARVVVRLPRDARHATAGEADSVRS